MLLTSTEFASQSDLILAVEEDRAIQASLDAELKSILSGFDLYQISDVKEEVVSLLAASVVDHSLAMVQSQSDHYERVRARQGRYTRFTKWVPDLKPSTIKPIFEWGISEFYGTLDEAKVDKGVSKVSLASQDFVARAGKDVVVQTGLMETKAGKGAIYYARALTGRENCAFCLMLVGRGAVYLTERTAGEGHKFHAHCDCQVVPVFTDGEYSKRQQGRIDSLIAAQQGTE